MVYNSDYLDLELQHYEQAWKSKGKLHHWSQGPVWELPDTFGVLVFPPSAKRHVWTYATMGMSQPADCSKLELHLFSNVQADSLIELLTVTSHYHRTGQPLGAGHTINFGRPWLPGSRCDRGLISFPYLDGPTLEYKAIGNNDFIRFLWLIPITLQEVEYKKSYGLDALEEAFEKTRFDYADPLRASAV